MKSEHLHNITDNKKATMQFRRTILGVSRPLTDVKNECGDELPAVIGLAHVKQLLPPLLGRHLTLPLNFKDADKL